eukprot:14952718-Alexandrium_andersonii.AAC.1
MQKQTRGETQRRNDTQGTGTLMHFPHCQAGHPCPLEPGLVRKPSFCASSACARAAGRPRARSRLPRT